MAEELLGPAFEIHGGGLDLVFPHHENELAQSRALGHPLRARSGRTTACSSFTGEKMSKSVGNIATLREVLDQWGEGDAARLLPRGPLAQADRLLDRDDGAGRERMGRRSRKRSSQPPRPGLHGAGMLSQRRSTTTSTLPRRWRCSTNGAPSQLDLLHRGTGVFGLGFVLRRNRATDVRGARGSSGLRRAARRETTGWQTDSATRLVAVSAGLDRRMAPAGSHARFRRGGEHRSRLRPSRGA